MLDRKSRCCSPLSGSLLLLVTATVLLTPPARREVAAQGESSGAAPAQETQTEAEESTQIRHLKARIAELENELTRAAAASQGTSPPGTAGAEPGVEGAPESAPARSPTVTVTTRAAGDAGLNARPGAAGEATIASLVKLIEARDGAGLKRELEKFLTRGEEGFLVLYDFLRYLDRNRRTGKLFVIDYRNAFGLMHLAMLHDVELARFSHYYLIATRDEPRSYMREQLYAFVPVFLKFYAGRFPDLESAFRADIRRRLTGRKRNLTLLFGAMKTLGFYPEIDLIRPLLEEASDYQHVTLLLRHLAERDDEQAAEAIVRFIQRKNDFSAHQVRLGMRTLAGMKAERAQRAVTRYMSGRIRQAVGPAMSAYFSFPRDPESSTWVFKYLNSDAELKTKRRFLILLRRSNAAVFDVILEHRDRIVSDQVRKAVAGE